MGHAQENIIFPINDLFKIAGFGTMASGKLVSGILKPGMDLEVKGRGEKTFTVTIGMIRKNNKEQTEAVRGDDVVIQLKSEDVSEIKMGMVISTPGTLESTKIAEVTVDMSSEGGLTLPVKTNSSVQVIIYDRTEFATIVIKNGNDIKPGGKAEAILKFSTPVAMSLNTIFQLKSGGKTIATGSVTKILKPE